MENNSSHHKKLDLSVRPTPSAPPPPSLPVEQQTLPQLPRYTSTPPIPNSLQTPILPIPQAPPLPPLDIYQSHSHSHSADANYAVSSGEISGSHQHQRPTRGPRRNPFQTPKQGKTETVPPPYPWATTQRATVHNLDYLLSQNMKMISGEVQCKRCEKVYNIEYDLETKFREIASYLSRNKLAMHDRAPSDWMNPILPSCEFCGSCLKPVVKKKRSINWLFLLLGQMLGCCKLSELKYFCKHTKNHRTGAKDRVLYLTYLGLCKQLDPKGPFDV